MTQPKAYRYPEDIPLREAMLVWSRGEKVGVVPHPDRQNLAEDFSSSVGACFSDWRDQSDEELILRLLIDAWHIAAFHGIPADVVHRSLLCIPEYRDTLARDCLPEEYQHERDD